MAASYKKLFKLLIDREMKSKDLAAKAGVSTVTLAKMKKDGATFNKKQCKKTDTSFLGFSQVMCLIFYIVFIQVLKEIFNEKARTDRHELY